MITRALLSVSDKTGLIAFAQALAATGVELLSTGGTAKALRDAGLRVVEVSDHTGFPEIMDGRVKTLHPKIHGGLLARRDDEAHQAAMQAHAIGLIDLVVINLYPFEATVARGAGFEECIENIDIGGPSMIRSAAKNHAHVTVLTDPADYAGVAEEILTQRATAPETRARLAAKAFARTAAYDAAISRWFAIQQDDMFPETLTLTGARRQVLHYGENPHQLAAFYAADEARGTLSGGALIQGERLSYNNINDASAALELVAEFTEPAIAIIKHVNPCGVAVGANLAEAYARALACDPTSAYGGIIAVNRPVDTAFAEALGKLFVEVLIAPAVEQAALPLLAGKKKMRVLSVRAMPEAARARMTLRTVSGGFLYQQEDVAVLEDASLRVVSGEADADVLRDARFAFTVAKHVKSNAIVLARGGATIGIGAGQMSRIDSTRIACWKAKEAGLETKGCVLASDAFFPFADNVEMAAEAGIRAIIQPGGSMRDDEVIAAAKKHGIIMLFTGMRHFRH